MDLNKKLTMVEALNLMNRPKDVKELRKLARQGDVAEIFRKTFGQIKN